MNLTFITGKKNRGSTEKTMSSSSLSMVPITYEYLRQLYSQYPTPIITPQLEVLRHEIVSLRTNLLSTSKSSFSSSLLKTTDDILAEEVPHGLDKGMYTLRCACDEAAQRLLLVPSLSSYSTVFASISTRFEAFQKHQSDQVTQLVNDFLPQDFRTYIFNMARQHTEKSNALAIDQLMASGGSVRDKYKLLWEQQHKRRETLASIGNSTGIFKTIVKYLAGVPDALLQFARQINSDRGPTEALREKYGLFLSSLIQFAIELNALTIIVSSERSPSPQLRDCVNRCLTVFEGQVMVLISSLESVLQHSPFFVSHDEIEQFKATQKV